jgi:hypothetical protein
MTVEPFDSTSIRIRQWRQVWSCVSRRHNKSEGGSGSDKRLWGGYILRFLM